MNNTATIANNAIRAHPANLFLRQLQDTAPQIDVIQETLNGTIAATSKVLPVETSSPYQSTVINALLSITKNDLFNKITYSEYVDLMRSLNSLRSFPAISVSKNLHAAVNNTDDKLSAPYKKILEKFQIIFKAAEHEQGLKGALALGGRDDPEFRAAFLDSAIRLSRILYRFGINIVNPSFSAQEGAVALPGDREIRIWLSDEKHIDESELNRGYLSIRPSQSHPNASQIEYRKTRDGPAIASSYISDEQSATVGRRLQICNFFYVTISETTITPDVAINGNMAPDSKAWSRLGILVTRIKNTDGTIGIMLWDRGCRHSVSFHQEVRGNQQLCTYLPTVEAVSVMNAPHTFGNSL